MLSIKSVTSSITNQFTLIVLTKKVLRMGANEAEKSLIKFKDFSTRLRLSQNDD